MIKEIDERRDLAMAGKRPVALAFCVEHFVHSAKAAIDDHGAFYVALSGGSTPKAIFQILTAPPYVKQVDWSKVHLFWSDERCVGPDDPESNYKMAMDAGFGSLSIPPDQIHRMKGELDPEEAAKSYEKVLPPSMDLIMLGMGEDGHTASLFPGTAALEEKKRPVVANNVPDKGWRITLTYLYLDRATACVFYVFGESKKSMIKKVLRKESPYPAAHVGRKGCKALWICDDSAI